MISLNNENKEEIKTKDYFKIIGLTLLSITIAAIPILLIYSLTQVEEYTDEDILEKNKVYTKMDLCKKIAYESNLNLLISQEITEENEELKNRMINKYGIEEYNKKKEKINKNLIKEESRIELNKIICENIDKKIKTKEYEEITKKITAREKIKKLNEILDKKLLEIMKDTTIKEINRIKILMKDKEEKNINKNNTSDNIKKNENSENYEKTNENLQFEGKFLSYENKNGITIAKVKRYNNQSIEYIKTTEEEIKKENYKISNGIDFIFSCGYRNETYLEECSMY